MKKFIAIFVVILMLTVCLVACNPETPDNNDGNGDGSTTTPCTHAYDYDCDTTCNNCGEERTATADHADANYDAKCDNCGADMDVVRRIADAEAWNNAILFNTTNNYIVRWDTVYPEGEEATFDGYEYIVQFDGVTRKVEVLYFIFDENGTKEYVHEYEGVDISGMTLVTKVDNKYYEYVEYNGESRWSETDQDYYDGFMSEGITSYAYDMFDQFTFNETTGQYEYTEDGVYVKMAFINGAITECSLCFDDEQPYVAEIKYGSVQTIEFPTCIHLDANYDAKCDNCGADMDVVRTIANVEEWNSAIAFSKSSNYCIKWTDFYSADSSAIASAVSPDGREIIITFDGEVKKWENKPVILLDNGEKEYIAGYDEVYIDVKVGDKYYEYYKFASLEGRWSEIDQEGYDNLTYDSWMGAVLDLFDEFTFNATTDQYEAATIVDSYGDEYYNVKIAFVNGVITGFSICIEEDSEPLVVEITHGGVDTIEYPEIVLE